VILIAKSIIIVFNHLHFLIDSYYDHYKTEIILSISSYHVKFLIISNLIPGFTI